MRHLFLIFILLFALFIPTVAAQEDDCDPAYLETRQADADHLKELIDNLTTAEIGNFYIELSTMRQKYEAMTDVPECVAELHRLMLAQIGANQDVVVYLLLSLMSENAEKYQDLATDTGVKIDDIMAAIDTELEKLGGVESSPLESALSTTEGVHFLRMVSQMGNTVYLEVDVVPGFNGQQMAETLRQVVVETLGNQEIEFSAILWDGQSQAVDYAKWTYEDDWIITPLSSAPETYGE